MLTSGGQRVENAVHLVQGPSWNMGRVYRGDALDHPWLDVSFNVGELQGWALCIRAALRIYRDLRYRPRCFCETESRSRYFHHFHVLIVRFCASRICVSFCHCNALQIIAGWFLRGIHGHQISFLHWTWWSAAALCDNHILHVGMSLGTRITSGSVGMR